MTNYLLIPGLGNSGPAHWQTYFEASAPTFRRVEQKDWDTPACADWVDTLEQAVAEVDPATVVLIGHSLGCTAIAHWATRYKKTIKGAMLVAPSDVEAPQYTFPTTGFAPIPLARLPFPTIVVASANDKWVSLARAQFFAEHWGRTLVNLGNAGHINVDSGHTNWDEGLAMLNRLG